MSPIGFCKNGLCLPRPPAPPIVPLHRCSDWSLPSHHAVLSVNVPWYIWAYVSIHYGTSISSSFSTLLFVGVALWSFLIMFSRMYLGVHSPADILTGGIMGCTILVLWLQNYLLLEYYLSSSSGSLLVVLVLTICLLSLHPDPKPTTIIFAETVCMVGVAVGALVGWLYNPIPVYATLERMSTYSSLPSLIACCMLRWVILSIHDITGELMAPFIAVWQIYPWHDVCRVGQIGDRWPNSACSIPALCTSRYSLRLFQTCLCSYQFSGSPLATLHCPN